MIHVRSPFALLLQSLLVGLLLVSSANSAEPDPAAAADQKLPRPTARAVDFHKDILAILANSCAKCHSSGQAKGGFSIDTRESFLQGGESGPAVIPGKSGESLLVLLVTSDEPDARMPKQGPKLTDEQVGLLRGWIDQGLKWEDGFTFKKQLAAPLEPRKVNVPPASPGSNLTNPIDRLLAQYYIERKVAPGKLVDDRTFLRRISLDLNGLLPSAEEVSAFAADKSPDKRAAKVRELLDRKQQYALHWLSFWNDALRNDYRGTGYIDGGRLQITDWLCRSLVDNMPFDAFVRQLIDPTPESAGFIKGIIWRGTVNASQVAPVQAAQNISQVFLGINLKCASCHDSFINDWKLNDAYGLAGVFADDPLEVHLCDQPTGKFAEVKFLYPQLGSIDGKAPKEERLKQLALAMTSPGNGRLQRTIVNRLWARMLGRGLVFPVDEMDNPAWSADLLDFLASDLAEHSYDLKHTLALIATSQAYQSAPVSVPENSLEEFVFRGPAVRRLTAEQLVDAVADLAGVEYAPAAAKPAVVSTGEGKKAALDLAGRAGARASLVNADPLLTALGRSNREQVVTERPQTATTLQALELTNGAALAELLHKGAKKWTAQAANSNELITALYAKALQRPATDGERALAVSLLGDKPRVDAVEDLLWAIVMLGEFQLIY